MAELQFGWVIQPSAPSADDASALLENNSKFLDAIRGRFSSAWVEDHFQWGDHPTLECWTTLSYYSARHPDFLWGTMVLGQAYRSPALTAKIAATLQFLTAGRLVLGIGAGWKEDEHSAYGWRMAPPRERMEQLSEAVQVIRAMWSESPANFTGRYYEIKNAYCEPRPEPPIPLMLGTSGERTGLRLAARYADWWNQAFATPEEFKRKAERLDECCREINRDPAEVVKTHYAFVSLSESPDRLKRREGMHVVTGSPDEVTRELEQFRDVGASHLMLRFIDFPETEGLGLFLQKVMPRLRER